MYGSLAFFGMFLSWSCTAPGRAPKKNSAASAKYAEHSYPDLEKFKKKIKIKKGR